MINLPKLNFTLPFNVVSVKVQPKPLIRNHANSFKFQDWVKIINAFSSLITKSQKSSYTSLQHQTLLTSETLQNLIHSVPQIYFFIAHPRLKTNRLKDSDVFSSNVSLFKYLLPSSKVFLTQNVPSPHLVFPLPGLTNVPLLSQLEPHNQSPLQVKTFFMDTLILPPKNSKQSKYFTGHLHMLNIYYY